MDIFNGEKSSRRDIVVLNAATALAVSGKVDNISKGIELATKVIDDGSALKKLNEVIEACK